MKWLIASDIHGSAYWCEKLMALAENDQPDKLVLLGDLLYHGPRNDLPEGYAPKEVMPLLNGMKPKLLCVRGNCDADVDQMVLQFPILAEYCFLALEGVTICAAHGHRIGPDDPPPLQPGDYLLCGHIHIPVRRNCGTYTYLNPGSVSIPKNGSARSYMTLEDTTFTWKTLPGEAYHTLTI